MIISKSKLVPMLVEQGFIASPNHVTYEAYGRKVMAYVRTASFQDRLKLEAFLTSKGITFNRDYFPGSALAEVRVSYFKAWHHDE